MKLGAVLHSRPEPRRAFGCRLTLLSCSNGRATVLRPHTPVPKGFGPYSIAVRPKRFGLVFGSGVSRDFQIPDWRGLLERIANHEDVQGLELLQRERESPVTMADLLRRHFDARMERVLRDRGLDDRAARSELTGRWLRIIRDLLYRDAPLDNDLEDRHPYLSHFLDIVLGCGITVNYNFDSCVEMMLRNRQRRLGIPIRQFEVAYDDFLATGVQAALVYHPNGYLPKNVLEGCSSDIVLSEREFNEQMADTFTVRNGFLAQHFAEKTCLFLGLSIQDDLLRSVLRRTARANPGQFHYCVEWVGPEDISDGLKSAIFRSRFDNYNLITLFLTSDQIAAFGHLIQLDRNHFLHLAERAGVNTTFTYYVTGVPGVGKTSSIRHFHSLQTYGEWAEEPILELATPFHDLTPEQADRVDRWIARQFALKNAQLCLAREGIHLVDRTPLDPLSFTPKPDWPAKAGLLRQLIQDQSRDAAPKNGSIIHLVGDSREIAARLSIYRRMTQRVEDESYDPARLEQMDTVLRSIYSGAGVSIVRTEGASLQDVVRRVAAVIFLDEYSPFDIGAHLQRCADAHV